MKILAVFALSVLLAGCTIISREYTFNNYVMGEKNNSTTSTELMLEGLETEQNAEGADVSPDLELQLPGAGTEIID